MIMLKEKGLDINLKNTNGDTVLILAAQDGVKQNNRIISKLLELGADKNITNSQGQSFENITYQQALKDKDFNRNFNIISNHKDLDNNKNSSNLKKARSKSSEEKMNILRIVLIFLTLFTLIVGIINKNIKIR